MPQNHPTLPPPATLEDVILRLGGLEVLSRLLNVTVQGIRHIRDRESLPGKYWTRTIALAAAMEVPLTLEDLARISDLAPGTLAEDVRAAVRVHRLTVLRDKARELGFARTTTEDLDKALPGSTALRPTAEQLLAENEPSPAAAGDDEHNNNKRAEAA